MKSLSEIQVIPVLNLVAWLVYLKKKQRDHQGVGDLLILWHFVKLSVLRPKYVV